MGVIGGSGLYDLEGLNIREQRWVDTPYGRPSGPLLFAELDGKELVFLARHGPGHRVSPSNLPYLANMYALKAAGVTQLLSVSAVGSMRQDIAPGDIVFPDQLFDRTLNRPRTFFDEGVVAHVGFGEPFCMELHSKVVEAARSIPGLVMHVGGTYICIEGPQFSTKAESQIFRSWGVSIIGMTNLPEARLAREAEISYATMALVTDYDCWHEAEEHVSVEAVIETLHKNVAKARQVIVAWARSFDPGQPRKSPVKDALKGAVMTSPTQVPPRLRERYGLFLDKYWR